MAISFASATGNLMNRLGKLGLMVSQARAYQAAQLTNITDTTNGAVAQFNAESDIQAILGSSYVGVVNGVTGAGSVAQQVAQATVNRMVYRDNPQPGQTLTQGNVAVSIDEIIRQMLAAGATVRAQTVAATPSAFSGTGNGVVVVSLRRPFDGLVLENAFAETAEVTCTVDSYTGGATAGNEVFLAAGDAPVNVWDFEWPKGSGGQQTLLAVDGEQDNAAGNLLTNSGFDAFTSNVPDNWTLVVGTAGTNVFQETTLVFIYSGGEALRFLGDGSTLICLTQEFDSGTGTAGTLDAQSQYSVNLWMRRGGSAVSAGVLTIDLIDGSNAVVLDNAGNANSFTCDLTTLSTTYAAYNGTFRTPTDMPDAVQLRLRLTTAINNGASVYLDKLSLGQMTQLYPGGPFLNVHSGSVPSELGDRATVVVTNSRGAGGTLNTFQTLLYRLLDPFIATNEFIFPSSSTPTISDGLIG